MKKAIKRFWGVGIIIIMLSALFVSAAPVAVSGNIYGWAADSTQPSVPNGLLVQAGQGIKAISQTSTGANIFITTTNQTLLQSTNGGVTWTQCSATGATSSHMDMVAVAPDSASIVAIADYTTTANTTIVYLSTNGGSSFSALTTLSNFTPNGLAISAQGGPYKWIGVVGHLDTTAVGVASGLGKAYAWPYGSAAPGWIDTFTQPAGPYAFLATSPSTVATAGFTTIDDVTAVAFSSSFPSDSTMLVTTVTVGGTGSPGKVTLHAASFNIGKWDNAIDTSFPRYLATTANGTALTSAAASIALDPTFYMGDPAAQIGFVGAQITGSANGGGIFRIGTYSVTSNMPMLTQTMTSTDIGSVAWDGTNLAAAPYLPTPPAAGTSITIYRSADSLSSSIPTYSLSSGPKTPGTGFMPKLAFNGGNLLCVTQGTNACVARSTDLGKSFNGISLVNEAWTGGIPDFQVTPNGSVKYVLADDGTDINVWRYMNSTWQRVMIMPNMHGQTWEMRLAIADPTCILLGLKGGANMYIATDSGEYKWTARSCSVNIQDMAVESNTVVYVAQAGAGNIVKSTNGAFTWGPPTATNIGLYATNNIYSIQSVAANNVMVTGTGGSVAYSSDGGNTWTALPPLANTSTSVLAFATGAFATGTSIYANSSTTGDAIYRWTIGTNGPPSNWSVGQAFPGGNATGLDMANGILYDLASTSNFTRFTLPGVFLTAGFYDTVTTGFTFNNFAAASVGPINALQVTTDSSSTTLWACAGSSLYSWTEYLAVAANGPATTFPPNGYMAPVNSINGGTNSLTFTWTQPPSLGVISNTQAYTYAVYVYLDKAGTITYTSGTVGPSPAPAGAFTPAVPLNPGTTYYWRMKTTTPVTSQWTAMQSFTVQAIAAAVPAIVSPANGATIQSQSPAFSWTPVSGTTLYDFQLSTSPSFGSPLLTDQPATAGDLVPVTIKLDQGRQYFWRVRANTPVLGDWSAVANFIVATPTTAAPPPVTITSVPAPVITIPAAPPATTITIPPQQVEKIAPSYIWAIIIIGGILVIAVIVLIVRTRRSV